MNLDESEEEKLLRQAAGRFLGERHDFAARKRMLAAPDGGNASLWTEFAAMGWLALPLPEDHGGLGFGAVALGILMQAFGRALVVEPYVPTVVLGAATVARLGDASQRAALLPAVAEGRVRLAFAHQEPGVAIDSPSLRTVATRGGDGWSLSGRKTLVLDGAGAQQFLVSARIGEGVAVFVVPHDAPGLRRDGYAIVDDRRAADVVLEDVAVGAGALLGGNEDAMPAICAVLDAAIAALSADAVGLADVLVESTIEYSRTRVQFGKPIGTFQALQHRIADMAMLREEIRSSALLAALKVTAAPDTRARAASSAKAKIGRSLRLIAQGAVQLHGAMGVTEELAIGACFKRATAYELLLGGTDFHLRRYMRLARGPSSREPLLAA